MHIATVHDGKKPYACTNCDVSFSHKGYLNRHIASVHEGKNSYVCKTCGKCFKKKNILLNHVRIVHENVRPVWKCTLCESTSQDQGIRKGFNVKKGTSLSRHMQMFIIYGISAQSAMKFFLQFAN